MTEEENGQGQLSAEDDLEQTVLRFVMQSPPEEENEVFKALETIVGPEADIARFKPDHFRQLNLEKYIVVELPSSSSKMLITPYGEIDETHYFDPKTKQQITFDHATRTVENVEAVEDTDSEFEPLRKAVEDALDTYVSSNYSDATYGVYHTVEDGDKNLLAVCINSTQAKHSAMWGGRWKSTWLIELADGKCAVDGKVEIEAHFYEAGNISFKCPKEFQATVNLQDDEKAFAKSVITVIQNSEAKLINEIDDCFVRLKDSTFKNLRRKLPISRTLINWDTFALQGNIGKAN